MGIKLGLGDGRGVKGLIDFELGLLQSYKVTENSGANAYQRFVKERLLIPEHLLERASALPAGWQGPSWRLAKVATSWIRMRSGADAEGQKAHADPAEDGASHRRSTPPRMRASNLGLTSGAKPDSGSRRRSPFGY